jgi:hypothetical protein
LHCSAAAWALSKSSSWVNCYIVASQISQQTLHQGTPSVLKEGDSLGDTSANSFDHGEC